MKKGKQQQTVASPPKKILFVASEATPFIKTGGLADVAGALPKALAQLGVDVRVMIPKYSGIAEEIRNGMTHVYDGALPVSWRTKFVGVDSLQQDGVTWYFIDNEEYFRRDSCYGQFDEAERFSFFSRAVLNVLPAIDFFPDVIHLNDWQTALVPILLKAEHAGDERYAGIKTLLTIHNLKYQGVFGKDVVGDVLGIDWNYFNNGDLEYYGAVNFLKGGIIHADQLTTVSKTYADEIQQEEFGEGLDGLLRANATKLTGIVNGIDNDEFNPATDKNLSVNYSPTVELLSRKIDNKVALQKELGLPQGRSTPIVAMITRLVEPKGLDLVMRIIDEVLGQEDMQFVLLGTGDAAYENWFRELAWRMPDKVSVRLGFDAALAQRIYAGSTMFLMPSRYEPCGIGQLIAMRYGAVPVVRATGGLQDTVYKFDKRKHKGNGFTFDEYNAHELLFTLKKALALHKDMNAWKQVVVNAMTSDFGWHKSAAEYIKLYDKLQ